MRAYLMEHEISRGTQLLTFEDGTPHYYESSLCSGKRD